MSANQQNLKAALLDFLKNNTTKQSSITLDCHWSHSMKLSDNKSYFFISKSLKKLLKDENKVPDTKTFKITLSKWNFVIEGMRKGFKEIDLDVKKYSIKPAKEEIDFSKRNKDLLEFADIKSKLETNDQVSSKKASVKKTKAKANEKVKEIHAEPKSGKQTPKVAGAKKRINKDNNSGRNSITKTLKPSKTPNRKADKSTPKKPTTQDDVTQTMSTNIPFIDIIKAKEFEGTDTKRSTTKILRFQTNTGMSRVGSPHQVNQESLHRLSSALGKASIDNSGFDNVLPESLKNHGLTYKEFLVGRDKGLVSAKEIVFSANAIELYLKEFEKRTVNPYN